MAVPAYKPAKVRRPVVVLKYEPLSPKHCAFHNAWANHRVRGVVGGIGTGKTIASLYEVLRQLLDNPIFRGKTALVVGVTAYHVRTQLLKEAKGILNNFNRKGQAIGAIEGRDYKISLAPLRIYDIGEFNGEILFASIEAGDALRGHNVSIVYCDDLGSTDEKVWNHLLDRCRRQPDPGKDPVGFALFTANPTSKSHWLYKRYFEEWESTGLLPPNVYLDRWTMFDNPALKADWGAKELEYRKDPTEYRRKIMGEWCSQEGVVYRNFDRERHILHRPLGAHMPMNDALPFGLRNAEVSVGIDFGQRDPTCAVFVARYDNKFYIFKEYWNASSFSTISGHARYLKNQPEHVLKYYSDHYSETVATYRECGVNLTLADKGHGSVVNGISLINQLFGDNRLFVSEDCKNVIRELESYEWKSETQRDEPKDKDNHSMDAMRYVLYEIATRHSPLVILSSRDSLMINGLIETPPEIPLKGEVIGMLKDGSFVYASLA